MTIIIITEYHPIEFVILRHYHKKVINSVILSSVPFLKKFLNSLAFLIPKKVDMET